MSNAFSNKIKQIKSQAAGKWEQIIKNLTSDLDEALKHPAVHTSCPVHGGDDGFRVFKDFAQTGGGICNSCGSMADGFALLSWVLGEPLSRVVRMVEESLNGTSGSSYIPRPAASAPTPKAKDDGGKSTLRLRKVWAEAVGGTAKNLVLGRYLYSRGLPLSLLHLTDGVIKAHQALPCWQRNEHKEMTNYGQHFALVSLVETMSGEGLTIHRTYLESCASGWRKAQSIPKSKTIMPLKSGMSWESCAVKLGKPSKDGMLNIAEGIETSLAVIAMGESHCWSAINANNISYFTPPKGVKEVVLWADKDRPCQKGIRAGHAAAEKLRRHLDGLGIKLRVKFPPMAIPEGSKGVDWLDYYNSLPPAQKQCS